MKIYTIRHAESVGNAQGAYSTKESDDLSPKGVLQAEGLSDGLDGLSFDHIFVSPTDRTLLTIAPYLKKKGKVAEVWPDLSEGCWHEEREPASETWKTVPASLNSELEPLFSFRNGEKVKPGFPQTFGDGYARVQKVARELRRMGEGSGTTVLLVSHAHFIREFLNEVLGQEETQRYPQDNAGVSLLSFDGESWSLEYDNRDPNSFSDFR